MRDVVWNEIQAQLHDDSQWQFRETTEDGGKTKLLEVVQTNYGDIEKLLAINGVALNAQQERAEQRRIAKVVANPAPVQAREKKTDNDAAEERNLLRSVPDAFHFRYEGQQGDVIRLSFTPNPAFRGSTHVDEVLRHMEGRILVYAPMKRLQEIDGMLTTPVKFWGGLLGHLDAGGTFAVDQQQVGPGHWEMTRLKVQMNGKALFFKTIAVHENDTYSDFHQVPNDITLRQAAEILSGAAH